MLKKIPQTKEIRDTMDLDDALKEMALNQFHFDEERGAVNKKIQKVNDELFEKTKPYSERIKEIIAMIEAFCNEHKEDLFTESKSIKLNFGEVGFRSSSKLEVDVDGKDTLTLAGKLKKAKRDLLVKVKTTLDKNALKKLGPDEMEALGVRMKDEDNFFCKPKEVTPV